ncbi:MAG: hypothetical protein R6V14_05260 [Halanaerobiales bacterium]
MDRKNDQSNTVRATKESWKTSDMPEEKVSLPIDQKYSKKEYNKIKQGFIPKGMEDRWFIYFEKDKLYLHRSWTGLCVYELNFIKKNEKYIISEGYLNAKIAEQGNIKGLKDEVNTVLSLVEMFLLNEGDHHTDWDMSFL